MILTLYRYKSDKTATLGKLGIDGKFFCYTLEDEFRTVKVFGETRIPAGTYNVLWTPSARFGREMLLIDMVPGFSGIRIHAGNTEKDTSGCILVGQEVVDMMLIKSRAALLALESKVMNAALNKQLKIVIIDGDR
jgi:hypothetical protein